MSSKKKSDMKILVLTEGGEKIGFGHITRCVALCDALEEYSINYELLVKGDSSIQDLVNNINFKIYDWIKNKKIIFETIYKSDFVFIDSYLAEKSFYDEISEVTNGRVLAIDDYNRIDYPKGIIVNPSVYGDKLDYCIKNYSSYLLGREYIILRKEFWDVPEKKIRKKVENILITFGGMNNFDLENQIFNLIKEKFNISAYIINVKTNKLTAKEMLNLMLECDICISGGGQTTYELARVGVPTVGICLAENQKFNLTEWKSLGFIEDLFWENDYDGLDTKMCSSLKNLFSYKKRKKISEIGRSYVDGKGAINIINKILK